MAKRKAPPPLTLGPIDLSPKRYVLTDLASAGLKLSGLEASVCVFAPGQEPLDRMTAGERVVRDWRDLAKRKRTFKKLAGMIDEAISDARYDEFNARYD